MEILKTGIQVHPTHTCLAASPEGLVWKEDQLRVVEEHVLKPFCIQIHLYKEYVFFLSVRPGSRPSLTLFNTLVTDY